jgi:hypothetical protein
LVVASPDLASTIPRPRECVKKRKKGTDEIPLSLLAAETAAKQKQKQPTTTMMNEALEGERLGVAFPDQATSPKPSRATRRNVMIAICNKPATG